MTLEGAQALRAELAHLKSVERPRITKAIATAREHGDLRENAEYHAAREQQSFSEGRISEIEGKLANAEIIDVTSIDAGGRVVFGATCELVNTADGVTVIYKIVGEDEADIKRGKVSINSPIARALIGKQRDDVVEVRAPGGVNEYEVASVRYV
jgi:transcription elongation factor GreA